MNIYLLKQDQNTNYDTYDSFVYCAESEEEAIELSTKDYGRSIWSTKEHIYAKYLGVADVSFEKGEVIGSFNAG